MIDPLRAATAALCVAAFVAPPAPPSGQTSTETLLVLVPASLADVMPRVVAAWEAAGGAPVRLAVDATSRLAPQVVAGAPADVFVSADRRWMAWVRDRGGVVEPVIDPLLGNRLVVVVPAGGDRPAPATPAGPSDLAGPDIRRLALAGENVPAGRYARSALDEAGVWDALADRVVRGGSVRGALEWVGRGEADAGVVYATDASADPAVRIAFAFGDETAREIAYTAAVAAASEQPERARAFLEHLRSAEATSLFREAGFVVPDPGASARRSPGAYVRVGANDPATEAAVDPLRAVRLSLVVGVLAALLGLVPAVAAGWLLARRSFPGKAVVSTLLLAPLVLPPVVTGFLLLMLFGREGPVGGFMAGLGIPVPFTPLAPVLAAVVVGFPLYVVAVRGAFEAVDPRFEEVSWTLGRPPRPTFFRVALPLSLPGVAAGAVLAFARALGEFGATVVLAGNVEGSTRTIPLAVYTLLEAPGDRTAMWTLVGASVVLSLLALLGYEELSRRQRRRLEDHRVH